MAKKSKSEKKSADAATSKKSEAKKSGKKSTAVASGVVAVEKPKPAPKSKSPAKPKVSPAAKTPAKSAPKPRTAAPRKRAFTTEDVALRAYFIAEERTRKGLPGNSESDWIEAERQLAAESKAKPRKKAGGKS